MVSNPRQRSSRILSLSLLGLAFALVTGLPQSCGSKEKGDKGDKTNTSKTADTGRAKEPTKKTQAGKSEGEPDNDTGWTNGGKYPPIGSPKALQKVKDRPFRLAWNSFPPTLRTDGPQSNLIQTATIHGLMYEGLVGLHPNTEEFIPMLAKEWRIQTWLPNKEKGIKGYQVFWYRLDPRAKFSTGKPVTAKDVYYSFWHLVQEDRKDPSNVLVFKGQF